MIPQGKYSDRAVADLLEYLVQESTAAENERRAPGLWYNGSSLEEKWVEWQAGYSAQPWDEIKTFPFYGASNMVSPIIATDVDTMFAQLMGLLMDPVNLWSMQASSPEMESVAPRIQEFLQWAQKNELKLERPIGNWLLEILKLGTGVLKQRYSREMKKIFEWREVGTQVFQQQLITLLKDAPAVHHVRLFDFWVPSGYTDLQEAPWCGEDVWMTWNRFMKRVQAGIYQGSDRLAQWQAQSRGSQTMQAMNQISGYSPSRGNLLGLREFWLDFDIDGDGWDEAILCTVHIPSRTYVRLDLNPFFNQDKPYSVARFMRNENSFYGIGLGEMLDPYQEESTAMHNQRIDNGTVQNSQMFAVAKSNKNISATEEVYPSKIWLVDKPDDIKPLIMGSTSAAASIEMESFSQGQAQRRTGINDFNYGQPDASIGYATAYTNQQMMTNSTRRRGEVLREVRDALSETGQRVLEMYQQYNQHGKEFFALGAVDGMLVRQVLQFPTDLLRRGLRVNVTAIDVQMNKDSQIRTNTIVLQQVMQYYQQTMQAASYLANPQIPPAIKMLAQNMIQGTTLLMRRLLDTYGEQDIDKILPDLGGGVNAGAQQLAEIQRLIALAGGNADPTQPAVQPGMAGPGQAPPVGFPGDPGAAPQGAGSQQYALPPGQVGQPGVGSQYPTA